MGRQAVVTHKLILEVLEFTDQIGRSGETVRWPLRGEGNVTIGLSTTRQIGLFSILPKYPVGDGSHSTDGTTIFWSGVSVRSLLERVVTFRVEEKNGHLH